MNFIPTKIERFKVPHQLPEDPKKWTPYKLSNLPYLTDAVHASISCREAGSRPDVLQMHLDNLNILARTLQSLKLSNIPPEVGEYLFGANPTGPTFPHVVCLRLDLGAFEPRSLRLFPRLRELTISADSCNKLIDTLEHDCPHLKAIKIPVTGTSRRFLAPSLAWAHVYLDLTETKTNFFWGVTNAAITPENGWRLFREMNKQISFESRLFPRNNSELLHSQFWAEKVKSIASIADHHYQLSLAALAAFRAFRHNLFERTKYFHSSVELVKSVFLYDVGVEIGEARNPVLHEMFQWAPSLELFQLIFETKSDKINNMTPFERAKSVRPDYPFFWELPLFCCIVQRPGDAPVRRKKSKNHKLTQVYSTIFFFVPVNLVRARQVHCRESREAAPTF